MSPRDSDHLAELVTALAASANACANRWPQCLSPEQWLAVAVQVLAQREFALNPAHASAEVVALAEAEQRATALLHARCPDCGGLLATAPNIVDHLDGAPVICAYCEP